MKKYSIISIIVTLILIISFSSCKKYLDINQDPDTPQDPNPSSVLPAMLGAIPRGLQFDARYVSKYIQNFSVNTSANSSSFDQMGYASSSDANGEIWRQCYFGLGKNLDYMIENGTKNKQWDYVGASQVLKALMFQYATDYHGEIIFKEAFLENKAFFKYDSQEYVYSALDSLLRLGIANLSRTDFDVSTNRLSRGDYVYDGNNAKWIKFAWGLMARNSHRITNKPTYNADSVIAFCDRSLSTNTDDFLIPFDGAKNDDANFFGTFRNNLTTFRQSDFIVKLLDGTVLANTAPTSTTAFNRDPRMRHMLTCSEDTTNGNGGFRGVAAQVGDPNQILLGTTQSYLGTTNLVNARKRVPNLWIDSSYQFSGVNVNPSAAAFNPLYRHYLFADRSVMPIMTASEIQFIKAEAAFRKGDVSTSHTAYLKGINFHFDFINRSTLPRSNVTLFTGNPISTAERAAYLTSANVKSTPVALTLTDIMLQKYVSLWGWGFFETFVDMRRFHYTDLDPITNAAVYKTFAFPVFSADNFGKPVYRVRPRFNSEYVWNRDELLRIGALNQDYHTYECWFSQP
jgi:Starch-binding associating with outer membrane